MPSESPERLIAAIEGLSGEVRMLRDVMEEFRVCLEWAVHNDRLRAPEPEEPTDTRLVVADLCEKVASLTLIVEELRGVPAGVGPKEQRSLFPADERPTRRP